MEHDTTQQDEMEALQSIFMDEFLLLNESPLTYELIILADPEDSTLEQGVKARLRIEYTESYPNEPPIITPHVQHPLTIKDLERIKEITDTTCAGLIGTPMVFELSEKIREYLQERKGETRKDIEEEEKLKSEAKQAEVNGVYKTMKIDQEITSFTPVTLENYTKWRQKFDKEKEEEAKAKSAPIDKKAANIAEEIEKRPTGRQFFEMKKQQMQKKDEEAKEEVFYYDEEAFEDIGDVEDVDLSQSYHYTLFNSIPAYYSNTNAHHIISIFYPNT
eukprot:TRINITY_DN626_c0_g1_i1.p5 TRINITY_DN626_c0_g1~~TRINITY_DN626_c0_g1_i1.p5  ORF type:complete len:313 (-),score=54.91 TRINITY_DN626_c0_g1_i1:7663-8487(-)